MTEHATNQASWADFLQSQGAKLDPDGYAFFAPANEEIKMASEGNILADLSSTSILKVSGTDAETFLQSQLTNDIKKIDQATCQLSAYCTAKGRMLALFRIFKKDDDFYLLVESQLAEMVQKKLRMYVLRAKVTIDLLSNWAVIGVSGEDALRNLKYLCNELSAENNSVCNTDFVSILCVNGYKPRYILVGDIESLSNAWEKLSDDTGSTGHHAWQWLDIMSGTPVIKQENSETFVPQMTNLELINGVNFKKGCYPGQEIVARMQYLGKLKQRMFRLHAADASIPQAGDKIFSSSFQNQSAGTVVVAEPGVDGGVDLLAVVQIKAIESGDLHLESDAGPALTVKELPYSLN
jgi:folate-binding protein YgfZ